MLKLNINGYIYHLLSNYTPDKSSYCYDLCGVIKGLCIAVFEIILIIGVSSLLIYVFLLGWIVPVLVFAFQPIELLDTTFFISFFAFCILVVGVTGIIISYLVDRYYVNRRNVRTKINKQPSFFLVWYDGFKNKYCPRVEFVDKGEEG